MPSHTWQNDKTHKKKLNLYTYTCTPVKHFCRERTTPLVCTYTWQALRYSHNDTNTLALIKNQWGEEDRRREEREREREKVTRAGPGSKLRRQCLASPGPAPLFPNLCFSSLQKNQWHVKWRAMILMEWCIKFKHQSSHYLAVPSSTWSCAENRALGRSLTC